MYCKSKAQYQKIFKYPWFAFYQQNDVCLESMKTLKEVNDCPTNDKEFKERSENKNCNPLLTCGGQPLFYHCVRSEGMLVEVCAPKTQITGICVGHNGIFNTLIIFVKNG